MKSTLSMLIFSVLFFVYLLIEVFASLAVYMYMNLYHTQAFGYFVGLSQQLLSVLTSYFVKFYPELATKAFATILGEMGPKSILLLVLGLVVSALVRLFVWTVGKSFEGVRTARAKRSKPAAPAKPATA